MARVNKDQYVERILGGEQSGGKGKHSHYRDWWLIKDNGQIPINTIYLGKDYFGKKVRLKIEVIK